MKTNDSIKPRRLFGCRAGGSPDGLTISPEEGTCDSGGGGAKTVSDDVEGVFE